MATLKINDRFDLTTEHTASSYGQPVLVDREAMQAFGPADNVNAPDDLLGPETAQHVVSNTMSGQIATMREMMAKHHCGQWISDEAIAMVEKFSGA